VLQFSDHTVDDVHGESAAMGTKICGFRLRALLRRSLLRSSSDGARILRVHPKGSRV
jgi:hypothetical protein